MEIKRRKGESGKSFEKRVNEANRPLTGRQHRAREIFLDIQRTPEQRVDKEIERRATTERLKKEEARQKAEDEHQRKLFHRKEVEKARAHKKLAMQYDEQRQQAEDKHQRDLFKRKAATERRKEAAIKAKYEDSMKTLAENQARKREERYQKVREELESARGEEVTSKEVKQEAKRQEEEERAEEKAAYEKAHALYDEAKRKAPRASFRFGGLGETVTRPRATSMPKKLKTETTPSTWGKPATEPWDTWGSSKPAPLRTWGEEEPVKEKTRPRQKPVAKKALTNAKVTRKAKTSAITSVKKRKKGGKSQAKPARVEPKIWEKVYPITTPSKGKRIKQMRAKEQPRTEKGKFAKKAISEYDLEPKEFALRQSAKLERGEIEPSTYYRYIRNYDAKNPTKRFKYPRYRVTYEVLASRENIKDFRAVTGTYDYPNPTAADIKEVKDNATDNFELSGWKVLSIKKVAIYDQLTGRRLWGKGASY